MTEQFDTIQRIINKLIEFFVNYSFEVLGAILVLIGGWLLANWVAGILLSVFEKRKLDTTLSKFTANTVKIIILGFVALVALGKFGITIAPFIAALSAAAFGASLAIQGPLSNYGAGLSIILGRPFVVGDTITVAGVTGTVQEVKLASTILSDEDGVRITIPNKHIVGETIHNSKKHKVVEGSVGISYDSDPEAVVRLIRKALSGFQEVAQEPLPQIGIREFSDSSINIGFRYWVPPTQFYSLSCAVNLAIYKVLSAAGIKIPFPQREIRLLSSSEPLNKNSLSLS